MPVHTAINRTFFTMSWVLFPILGVLLCALAIVLDAFDMVPVNFTWFGFFPIGCAAALVFPVALSPPVRRKVLGFLGRLATKGEERQAAAVAVAALMGRYSVTQVLKLAKASFAGISFDVLSARDFAKVDVANSSKESMDALRRKIVLRPLGEVDVFFSHSWHDDADAKWRNLAQWAGEFTEAHQRPPMLWLGV